MALDNNELRNLDNDEYDLLVDFIGVNKLQGPVDKLYKRGKDLCTIGGYAKLERDKKEHGTKDLFNSYSRIGYFFFNAIVEKKSEDPDLKETLEGRLKKKLRITALPDEKITYEVLIEHLNAEKSTCPDDKTFETVKNVVLKIYGFKDKAEEKSESEEKPEIKKNQKELKKDKKDEKEEDPNEVKIKKLEEQIKVLEKEKASLSSSKKSVEKTRDNYKLKYTDLKNRLKTMAKIEIEDDVDETIKEKHRDFLTSFNAKIEELNDAVVKKQYKNAKRILATLYIELSLEDED